MIGKQSVGASRMEARGVNRQAGDERWTAPGPSLQIDGACRAMIAQASSVVVPPLLYIQAAYIQVRSRVVKRVCVGEMMEFLTLLTVRPRRHRGYLASQRMKRSCCASIRYSNKTTSLPSHDPTTWCARPWPCHCCACKKSIVAQSRRIQVVASA